MKQIIIAAIMLVLMIPISVSAQETESDCSEFSGAEMVRCIVSNAVEPNEQSSKQEK
jgi:hypothetical protein